MRKAPKCPLQLPAQPSHVFLARGNSEHRGCVSGGRDAGQVPTLVCTERRAKKPLCTESLKSPNPKHRGLNHHLLCVTINQPGSDTGFSLELGHPSHRETQAAGTDMCFRRIVGSRGETLRWALPPKVCRAAGETRIRTGLAFEITS